MPVAEIASALSALKTVRELVANGFNAKVDGEVQRAKIEVMEQLGKAQDTLYDLREELTKLQDENLTLKRAAEQGEAWADRLAQYELQKTPGGAVVYSFKGPVSHYACPSCINGQRIEPLQDNRTMSGKFRCVACKSEFPIEPAQRHQSSVQSTRDW